jgi:hypothetical protein
VPALERSADLVLFAFSAGGTRLARIASASASTGRSASATRVGKPSSINRGSIHRRDEKQINFEVRRGCRSNAMAASVDFDAAAFIRLPELIGM